MFASIVLGFTLITGFASQIPSRFLHYTNSTNPFYPTYTSGLTRHTTTHHDQTSDILNQMMADARTPKANYQTIYLQNNYTILFNQWMLYIIKDRKNILGKGVPFIQSQHKLTLESIKKHLMNTQLWPNNHTLNHALGFNVANTSLQ
jgi:hypothetical protein